MISKAKNVFLLCVRKVMRLSAAKKIALAGLLVIFLMGGFIVVSEQPRFCNSCHIMNTYYKSWQESSHSKENCLDCHLVPGFAGHVKGKINGLAQLVDCVVGRYGTKPNAGVTDISCLRSDCHDAEKLVTTSAAYKKTKFTHKSHVSKEVDGINISCTICHSHFEGNEHFSINTQACYTCHFLTNSNTGKRLVNTQCQSCHEVPKEIVKRAFVEINHEDFVSYGANCDDSCHVKQIQKPSDVSPASCLGCHSYRKDEKTTSAELHALHTKSRHKVECFACHGEISHKAISGGVVATMPDCGSCHANTHQLQNRIYAAQDSVPHTNGDLIVSPMFLTHVECTGCHIEYVRSQPENIGKNEMYAKAVPQACDKCHEPGTGEKYIPFWQANIKGLYEQINNRLDKLQKDHARSASDEKTTGEFEQKVRHAKILLETVASDGSWGVHNLKYSEDMLLKAYAIITELQEKQK